MAQVKVKLYPYYVGTQGCRDDFSIGNEHPNLVGILDHQPEVGGAAVFREAFFQHISLCSGLNPTCLCLSLLLLCCGGCEW